MRRGLLLLIGATFLASVGTACEGPQGPAGPVGPRGPEGEPGPAGPPGPQGSLEACSDCHSSDATIVALEQQFALSPHGFGNFEVRPPSYAGGSCAACHTSQGYVAAVTGTEADYSGGVASMSCRTCHRIHTDYSGGDFGVWATDPVAFRVTGAAFDYGGSNVCASCHQARAEDAWPSWDAPIDQMFEIGSTHYDLHHGPQANFFMAELPESFLFGVSGQAFGPHEEIVCTGCHMGLSFLDPAPDPVSDGELSHTFRPSTDVCAVCHDADFNYGGVQDDVMADVASLQECLLNVGVIEGEDGEYHPVVGSHPEPFVAAYLVWTGLREDGSYGVHNPRFQPDLVEATLAFMEDNGACP